MSRQEIWVQTENGLVREKVPAEGLLRLLYHNPVGGAPLLFLAKRKAVSRMYGAWCRSSLSGRKVARFIAEYGVDMTGCTGRYKTFADFFSREKSGVRFPDDPAAFGSPCEGMVLAYDAIDPQRLVAAKGSYFSLAELFGSEKLAGAYAGGSMLAIRLTPASYHRMHFFDDGRVRGSRQIDGSLFSVSPLAVGRVARLYCQNKRALTLFSSQNFGEVAIVEVGATFVGSIVHLFTKGSLVKRGGQASYFLPGGSLCLFFFKKGRLQPEPSILGNTAAGYETKVQIGREIGRASIR